MKINFDITYDNIDASVFVKKLYKKAEELYGKEFYHFDEFVRFLDDNDQLYVNVSRSRFENLIIKAWEEEE